MKTRKTFTQIIFFCSLIMLISFKLSSQSGDYLWKYAKTSTNGTIDNMLADSVGNIYLSGRFYVDAFDYQGRIVQGMSGNNESNVFLLKIAPTGRLIWIHSIRSLDPDRNIQPGNLAINQRGELATVFTVEPGTNFQIGNYTGTASGPDELTLIAKITKTGYIRWVNEIALQPDTVQYLYPPQLFLDEDGSTYVSGSFEGDQIQIGSRNALGTGDDALLYTAKILPNGVTEWLYAGNYASGDNADIVVTDIANGRADAFYIGGYFNGAKPFIFGTDTIIGTSVEDAFIARYLKDGNAEWGRNFPGDSSDYIEKMVVADNDDVFIAGMFNSPNIVVGGDVYSSEVGNYNMFLAKYSTAGDYRSSTSLDLEKGNFLFDGDNAFIGTDPNGNLIVCSDFYSDQLFSAANLLTNPEPGTSDMMMAKLDGVTLDPIWTVQGTANGHNYFEGASISRFGDVFITGTSYNKLNITTATVDENNIDGAPYVAKITTDGTLDYLYWQPNTTDNKIYAHKVVSNKYGNTFVAGNFTGPANMLDDNGLIQPGDTGMFIGKYVRVRNVSGHVLDIGGSPVSEGYVKIYGHTFFQRSPLNDSVHLEADGAYFFEDIPFGSYILVAVPEGEIINDFVQTYYPSFEYWEFAENVIVNATSVTTGLDIEMKSTTEFAGYTLFQGNVQEEEEDDLKSAPYLKARPSQKATVVLAGQKSQKSTYEIVATAETDAVGNFEFFDVENGSYYLWTDIPGLPVDDVYLIMVAGNSFVSSLDYLVTEETVIATGLPIYSSIQNISENSNISVYPNPAQEILIIELNNSTIGICDLYDAQGKLLQHVKLNSRKEILNISEYPAGSYFVRILTDNDIEFRKINFIR